jgi:threonine dehydratase
MLDIRSVRRPTREELDQAREIVARGLPPTPLAATRDELSGWSLKLESMQPTGSFKVRGALTASTLGARGRPVTTASTGNHALAMGWASARLGVDATVVVPETTAAPKLEALQRMRLSLVRVGASVQDAECHAIALAREWGGRYVSPYNDPLVIAGQATVADEILEQAQGPVTIVCPVGGGGLLAGLCLAAAGRRRVRLVGVEPAASAGLSAAVRAGHVVEVPIGKTIADGTAGKVEAGSVTVPIISERVDDLVTVGEDEIRAAIRWLATACGVVAEGAGACAVAAALSGSIEARGRGVMLVTGRNISPGILASVLTSAA